MSRINSEEYEATFAGKRYIYNINRFEFTDQKTWLWGRDIVTFSIYYRATLRPGPRVAFQEPRYAVFDKSFPNGKGYLYKDYPVFVDWSQMLLVLYDYRGGLCVRFINNENWREFCKFLKKQPTLKIQDLKRVKERAPKQFRY